MRTILSCDAVFDVLTRAPFPDSGSDSESVEAHLSVCHECRCLAEALRPAIGLFHEAMDDDSVALPTYRGKFHAPGRRRLASRSNQSRRRFGGGVLAASLLVAAGLLLAAGQRFSDEAVPHAVVVRPLADRDVGRLASLHLPKECAESSAPAAPDRITYDCCTKCHRADSTVTSSPTAIVKSSAACLACHEWYSLAQPPSSRRLLSCLMACDTTFRGVAWE